MAPVQGFSSFSRRPRPVKPEVGQESVWDYPRPPRVEASSERVIVRLGGRIISDTTDAVRVLETSHPPVYYLPTDSFSPGALIQVQGTSFCEFKGEANYYDVVAGKTLARRAGWTYPAPVSGYEELASRVALYPSCMESCEVGGEQVTFQEGDFYGGWITSGIVGPFKGGPGTAGW